MNVFKVCGRCKNWDKDKKECIIYGYLLKSHCLHFKLRKKLKPIIKFNNGIGAILCNKCKVIIKTHLTKEEFKGNTDILYCEKCLSEMDMYEILDIYFKRI